MDRQIKLSVRISRELPFINVEEIENFLNEHQWIKEKYEGAQRFDLVEIYDDLLDYLESKKERYSTLKQIISQDKKQQNNELDRFVSVEFKEYNFLKKIDDLRATLANNKEKLQMHLQFILQSLDKIIESQNNLPAMIDVDKFRMSNADEVIVILEFFGYKLSSTQNKGFTTLECSEPDITFTQNSIVHMSDNLKEELYYDEIQILKEQDRQKEIEKKLQSLNAHRHKNDTLYDFQRRQDIGDQKNAHKNEIKNRVQDQMKAQLFKSQNPFLSRQGYSLSDAVQQNQQSRSNNNANNSSVQPSSSQNIKLFEEFERLAEKDVLKHVNQYRESVGLIQLKWNDIISAVCRNHSINMGQEKVSFGHENFPERKEYIQSKLNKKVSLSCENVFYYYTYLGIAKNALQIWKDSHNNDENMLSNANYCGVGAYRNSKGIWYITMIVCMIEE